MVPALTAAIAAFALAGCGDYSAYPDHLPKLDPNASNLDRALAVQKWAEESCHSNPAGVAALAGLDPEQATYGDLEDALAQWFEENGPAAPPGESYHAAVTTGCAKGLDRLNG